MSQATSTDIEDIEYELWEEMKNYNSDRLRTELSSHDELRRFAAAGELTIRGENETFTYASTLANMPEASFREVSARILGQLGTPNRPFLESSLPILCNLLQSDPDYQVRAAAAAALGHLGSSKSLEYLICAVTDKEADVRKSVAFALGNICDERALNPLLTLTYDIDCDVACWAVIGLRLLRVNSMIVRDRLVQMLNDSRFATIFDEVIYALAEWQDIRVLPALLDEMNQEEVFFELLEAAGNLGDARVLPRLKSLLEEWKDDPPEALLEAIMKLERS